MKRAGVLAALIAALISILPARASADTAGQGEPLRPWTNPFCSGNAMLIPWDKAANKPADGPTDEYGLWLYADGKSDVAARVRLIDANAAYDVAVPRALLRTGDDRTRMRTLWRVDFDRPVSIGYYFVDAVGVDGAALADCPSFVHDVKPIAQFGSTAHLGAKVPVLAASGAQALPATPCGKVYTPIVALKPFHPIVGRYGDRALTASIDVAVDSDGNIVRTSIWKSSGVDGIDDTALGAAQKTAYKPATFLCTPVVSDGLFVFTYQP